MAFVSMVDNVVFGAVGLVAAGTLAAYGWWSWQQHEELAHERRSTEGFVWGFQQFTRPDSNVKSAGQEPIVVFVSEAGETIRFVDSHPSYPRERGEKVVVNYDAFDASNAEAVGAAADQSPDAKGTIVEMVAERDHPDDLHPLVEFRSGDETVRFTDEEVVYHDTSAKGSTVDVRSVGKGKAAIVIGRVEWK